MEILRGKLAQMQMEQHGATIGELRAGESAGWGQQIRNYVLQPYKLVKDTRTDYESKEPVKVLDGEIDDFIDDYLEKHYGADWKSAKDYLDKISTIFDPNALKQNTDITAQDTGSVDVNSKKAGIFGNEAAGDAIATAPAIVDAFAPTVEKNLALADPCHKESWRILTYHGEYCKRLSKVYYALSRNDVATANAHFDEMIDYLSEVEMDIHPYFDLVLFHQRTKQIIAGK
jgi:hypothetical protein